MCEQLLEQPMVLFRQAANVLCGFKFSCEFRVMDSGNGIS